MARKYATPYGELLDVEVRSCACYVQIYEAKVYADVRGSGLSGDSIEIP